MAAVPSILDKLAVGSRPAPHTDDIEALKLQRRCREKKAEIPEDLNLEKTKEGHIEATCQFRMYSSDVCWKGDVNLVQANLDRFE